MYLRLTKEDIYDSFNIQQLKVKKKYLMDTLATTANLPETEVTEINYLISLINNRMKHMDEISG